MAVVERELVPQKEITGVLTRLPCVVEEGCATWKLGCQTAREAPHQVRPNGVGVPGASTSHLIPRCPTELPPACFSSLAESLDGPSTYTANRA